MLPSEQRIATTRTDSFPLRLILVFSTLFLLQLFLPTLRALLPVHYTSAAKESTIKTAPPSFKLLTIGDWGRDGQYGQHQVARAMAKVAHDPRLRIVSTGDNFYEVGVESVSDHQFNTSYEQVYAIHARLRNTPWYPVLGNHDHFGDAYAQVKYSTNSLTWDMPATYYTRSTPAGVLLIFIDTTPMNDDDAASVAKAKGHDPSKQLTWLERTMAAASEPYFLIIGHHNLYSMSIDGHRGVAPVRKLLAPLIKRYSTRILAYICGHEHSLMHMRPRFEDTDFVLDHFVSGGGSQLDSIISVDKDKSLTHSQWKKCCGVVSGDEAVWGKAENGFFVFEFNTRGVFTATVYNEDAAVLYNYNKTVTPVAHPSLAATNSTRIR